MPLFTDNFSYAPGDLHTANASWVELISTFNVVAGGGVCGGTPIVNALVAYEGVTLNPNQQATVIIANPAERVGPAVRCSASGGGNAYWTRPNDGGTGCDVYKIVAGGYTNIGSTSSGITWATGDVLKITVFGSTITVLRNGALIASVIDSSLTTGSYAGMICDSASNSTSGASQFSCANYGFVSLCGAFGVGI